MSASIEPRSSRIDRRAALKLIAGGITAVVPMSLAVDEAAAGRSWCRLDPQFRVDGLVGNVFVSGELDTEYDTTGPIQLLFRAPVGCTVELLAQDAGFGYGYDISYDFSPRLRDTDRQIDIEVEVLVPAISDALPIMVEFVPDETVMVADMRLGVTNQVLRVRTELRKPDASPAAAKASR